MADDGAGDAVAVSELMTHDLSSLLSVADRDFLVRNNGDQVKIDTLKGKKVGLYFSASWCGPCQRFTPRLIEVYNDLSSQKESRDNLDELFKVRGIPHLVILDENGKVLTDGGVEIIQEYGVEGYPFTAERIKELKEQEEAAKKQQTLKSILASQSRDFVISKDRVEVPISELEGKTVGLYFSLSTYRYCIEFTSKLVEIYEKLKAKKENFEVVLISLDDDEESFKQEFGGMPWFSLPFKDNSCVKLARYFELSTLPTLVIIGPDGKTLHPNVAEAVEYHGIQAYPFTTERFEELAEVEKARKEAQTLESILVSGDQDFLINRSAEKVLVSDLVGKNILLYFSAHWCPPCRAFLPKLVELYHKIKERNEAFEVIFISSDSDQDAFNEYFATMPWLALPFGDQRKNSLTRSFRVNGIPKLVAIGPNGKTVTTEARDLIAIHGAEAYPFTDNRLKEIEAAYAEVAKGWPEKVKHALHDEHELTLTRHKLYTCDGCEEEGDIWSFSCEECDFFLHPECALEEDKENSDDQTADI
ncbi:hypothetical protein Ancab_020502 [Ancistrocladus abbreviatus]